jgi:hypothetical protein
MPLMKSAHGRHQADYRVGIQALTPAGKLGIILQASQLVSAFKHVVTSP